MKLDFPHFNGEDPVERLYKANQFFAYHNIFVEHRILIASFHLEGKFMPWFQEIEESSGLTSWDAFAHTLQLRFGATV